MTELSDYQRIIERPAMAKLNHSIDILSARVRRLERSLFLALDVIGKNEPHDSRAVSPLFVALAAVATGNENTPIMSVIDDAFAVRGGIQS